MDGMAGLGYSGQEPIESGRSVKNIGEGCVYRGLDSVDGEIVTRRCVKRACKGSQKQDSW